MKALASALLLWCGLAAPVLADEAETIDRWYAALAKADGEALAALLAPDAAIRLQDVGVAQTKAEFVASMDEWKSAIAGGSIRYKPDGASAYKVCYDFPNNDLLTREVFTFANGLIASSEQLSLAKSCGGF